MRKLTLAAVCVLMLPAARVGAVEGCAAANPGQESCRYRASTSSDARATGTGNWIVTVKHGRRTINYSPSGSYGEPNVETVKIHKGDTVTAKALSAGASVVIGGP